MRYLFLSLSAMVCFGLVSCTKYDTSLTQRQMFATIKRNSADSGITWNANPNLVTAKIPFARSVRFEGSEFGTNPTHVNIFINNYTGVGIYPLFQGSAQQTDSNSAIVTYISRDFHTIKGSVQVLLDDKDLYIGIYQFTAVNLNDTITINYGAFTINK
ncbi:MAG: hypothetical protein QM530_04655 [Phycisphaerales bacterium]|nr:hypothetical protein [Phycisphaerales bacterium]